MIGLRTSSLSSGLRLNLAILVLPIFLSLNSGLVETNQGQLDHPATADEYVLLAGSKVWIEGTSNVHDFSCNATRFFATSANNEPSAADLSAESKRDALNSDRAYLIVPVDGLDCGKGKMNADLRKALGSDKFPNIVYRLHTVSAETTGELSASGTLTLAGVDRSVSIAAAPKPLTNSQYQIRGTASVRLTEFGVAPPIALFGLVKVRDEIEVHFDLLTERITM